MIACWQEAPGVSLGRHFHTPFTGRSKFLRMKDTSAGQGRWFKLTATAQLGRDSSAPASIY